MITREVQYTTVPQPTVEGAGVRLQRVFGFGQERQMDPFLLLDDFHSDHPEDYLAGFPWHPHRGIETVTVMLAGGLEHEDSLGHRGVVNGGDVQWMTAGSGIVHQEMPTRCDGHMQGFQLWLNLPRADKMSAPRYQGFTAADIPGVGLGGGATARVVCGRLDCVTGPVAGRRVDPFLFVATLPADAVFSAAVPAGHRVFAYLFDGSLAVGEARKGPYRARRLVVLGDGDRVELAAGPDGARFLLVGGRPLGEPIAWHGRVVMNTRDELIQAFDEYAAGTFLRHRQP